MSIEPGAANKGGAGVDKGYRAKSYTVYVCTDPECHMHDEVYVEGIGGCGGVPAHGTREYGPLTAITVIPDPTPELAERGIELPKPDSLVESIVWLSDRLRLALTGRAAWVDVPPELTERHPDIDWSQGVVEGVEELRKVWQDAENDLGVERAHADRLAEVIDRLLAAEGGGATPEETEDLVDAAHIQLQDALADHEKRRRDDG